MSERLDKLQGNIGKFTLFEILRYIFFCVPVIVLFWQEHGMNLTEVMVLQSYYSILVVGLEIPTGYFADILGRKTSLVMSSIFMTAGISAYSVGVGFWSFLIAETLLAFATTLSSGANSALLYDTLLELKREGEFKKIFGNVTFWSLVVLGISNVAGGFIGKIDYRWTFYAMIPFTAMTIPIGLSLIEPNRVKFVIKKNYLAEILQIIKLHVLKNKSLFWLISFFSLIFGLRQAILWLYQPYFQLSGLDVIYFGIIFALFQLAAALSAKYSYWFEKALGPKNSLLILPIIVGSSYILMSLFISKFSFLFALLQQFARGFHKTIANDYINKLTSSDIRATVLSVMGMSCALVYALIMPFIGWFADIFSIEQSIMLLGILTFLLGGGIASVLLVKRIV